MSVIDFSAQFGGRDAADEVLPHFKALKAAKEGICFEGFPFPELSFVLRVDGVVTSYGFSGVGDVEVGRKGEYLAVDIGILINDRGNAQMVISDAIRDSVSAIDHAVSQLGDNGFDRQAIIGPIEKLRQRYLSQTIDQNSTT